MTCDLVTVCVDAVDPAGLTGFWAELLGREANGTTLLPGDDTGFRLQFVPTDAPKVGRNRMHLDLTSTSLEDQQRTVGRALELGGRHLDVGQRPEEPHVVLADPEGNEFCVIEPGNAFLAGCGVVGALACDGSQQVGYFWSAALDWPLVWDRDQETAIRSPHGGPKISWGGPPLPPKTRRNRLHLDVVPAGRADQQVQVDRLVALGAVRIDADPCDSGGVAMADPDGNEFCVAALVSS